MKFALFYEIPVPRPWTKLSEYQAFHDTLEEAVLADQLGFHGFWSVEHHFLEEFSHCSNPEVLYGAIAARTRNLRIGYGVRLVPKPYNHPVRSAESAAVLDLLSNGRVDFGTGRSVSRTEMEGFGINPSETRQMWREGLEHIIGCWTNDEYEFEGKYWSMPRRRVVPKPLQDPHPPVFGATGTDDGHQMMGELGLGLCSFGVGRPPEDLKKQIDLYRAAIEACQKPLGNFVNNQVAAFTMVNCAPTKKESYAVSARSFEWYNEVGFRNVRSVAEWLREMKQELGNYAYTGASDGMFEDENAMSFPALRDSKAVICGDPDQVIETCRAYEAAGVDILLCLVNPHAIAHAKVMQTIELIGKYVIPEFE
jgi:alkanesulfonate monooxygenase SsuD/methylene tetrahydromethanopterin reductase-like flavin-dependent oxidoreductase (luciferase family)